MLLTTTLIHEQVMVDIKDRQDTVLHGSVSKMDRLSLDDLTTRCFKFPAPPRPTIPSIPSMPSMPSMTSLLPSSPPPAAAPEIHHSPLDRTAFPHIFDTVFRYCPYDSLIVLRATCSELRDQVDEVLLYHIVVRAPPAKGSIIGRLLNTLATPPSSVRSALGRIPRIDWSLDEHLADAVRVVDIDRADSDWDLSEVEELRRLPSVVLTRFRGDYLRNMDADIKTLDPTNVLGNPDTVVRMHRTGHPVFAQYPREEHTIITSPVYYTTTAPLLWCSNPKASSSAEGKLACCYAFQRIENGALHAVDSIYAGHMVRSIAQAALRSSVHEVILVEGEAWAKSWNEHAGNWNDRQMRNSLRTVILDAARDLAPRHRDRDKVAKVKRKLKFLTIDQYKAVLGDQKYDLLTKW